MITSARAFGDADEAKHPPGMLDKNAENLKEAGVEPEGGKKITALAGPDYYSEENFRACKERGMEAVIPGSQAKRRLGPGGKNRYEAGDFKYNEAEGYYECRRVSALNKKAGRH